MRVVLLLLEVGISLLIEGYDDPGWDELEESR